jgi:UDP-arabinose 4-epimerase
MGIVLVTGGAGYIGSHACKALAAAGYQPVVVDSLSGGHAWAVKWGPLERGDVRDAAFLESVFARWSPQAVLHFAGLIQVGESVVRPDLYYDSNVVGSLTLLEAMRRHGVGRLVFSSTCAIFGQPDGSRLAERSRLAEDLPHRPVSPYGASKAMVERLLADYAAAHGLRAVALRYFNAAGADPQGEIGEAHHPETHLVPLAIDAALGRRPALQVFGDDYPTPDGTCVRDYVHVGDLADAHVRALAWMERAEGFDVFNLGNGDGYSVRQVIDAVERVSGRAMPVSIVGRRPGDPPSLVADSTMARARLGWSPALPAIDDIVATAWRWHVKSGG